MEEISKDRVVSVRMARTSYQALKELAEGLEALYGFPVSTHSFIKQSIAVGSRVLSEELIRNKSVEIVQEVA